MTQLLWKLSYVDKRLVPTAEIQDGDDRRPAPVRDRWPRVAMRLDYRDRLGEIQVPALICVGRYDPQTPVACSEELAGGIPGAQLVIFENSGHYPFTEEREHLMRILAEFLG
jgi:proline iminopeptidase